MSCDGGGGERSTGAISKRHGFSLRQAVTLTLVFFAGMGFRDVFNGGSRPNLMTSTTTQEKEHSNCSMTTTTAATAQEDFDEWKGALDATLRHLTLNETVIGANYPNVNFTPPGLLNFLNDLTVFRIDLLALKAR